MNPPYDEMSVYRDEEPDPDLAAHLWPSAPLRNRQMSEKIDRSKWFTPDAIRTYFSGDPDSADGLHPRIMAMLDALPALADEVDSLRAQVAERGAEIVRITSDRDAKTARMWQLGKELDTAESALRACEAEREAMRNLLTHLYRGDTGTAEERADWAGAKLDAGRLLRAQLREPAPTNGLPAQFVRKDGRRQTVGEIIQCAEIAESAIRACEAEREALRKDAERYQWVRNDDNAMVLLNTVDDDGLSVEEQLRGEALDEEIDAALAQPREPVK